MVPKRIQVVEDDDRIPEAPGKPIFPVIPKLDVGRLAFDDPEDEQSLEWVSSNPGRCSSRIPDLPLEPEPEPKPQKVQFEVKPAHIPKRIKSKPRPVPKSDAQMQTDEVEIETVSAAVSAREPDKEKVDVSDLAFLLRES